MWCARDTNLQTRCASCESETPNKNERISLSKALTGVPVTRCPLTQLPQFLITTGEALFRAVS